LAVPEQPVRCYSVDDVTVCPSCSTKNRVPSAASGVPRCGKCHRPLPWVADAGDADFAEVVEASVLPVVVDVWAPWCGPCRAVSPILDHLATELAGRVKLVKVNADTAPGLSGRFGVQAIPTMLVMRRGEVIARQTGAAPEPVLRQWLEDALRS
jgi:thioredoxin 2